MAISIAKVERFPAPGGDVGRHAIFDATLDASYPAGGYPISAAALGWKGIFFITPVDAGGAAYFMQYNRTTGKLMVFWCAAAGTVAAEVTAATNLSAVVVRLECRGW